MMKIQKTAVRAGGTAIVSCAFSHHPEHPQGDPAGARFRRRAAHALPLYGTGVYPERFPGGVRTHDFLPLCDSSANDDFTGL